MLLLKCLLLIGLLLLIVSLLNGNKGNQFAFAGGMLPKNSGMKLLYTKVAMVFENAVDDVTKVVTQKLDEAKTGFKALAKEEAEAQYKKANDEIEKLKAENKTYQDNQKKQQDQLDDLQKKSDKFGQGVEKIKSFGDALKDGYTKCLEAFKTKGGEVEVDLKVKAITSANFTGDSAGSGGVIPAMREAGINKEPKRMPFIRDLAFNGSSTSDIVSWTEKVTETGAPIPLAELEAYPEEGTTYQQFSTPVKKIGGLTKVSEEKLEDVNWMMNEIQSELVERHDLVVDTQLFNGNGTGKNLKGVLQYAPAFDAGSFAGSVEDPTRADVLRVAYNQIIIALFRPTAICLHPTDVAKMELEKDANGNSVIRSFVAANGLTIKGLPVIENIGVAEGSFLIGDFSRMGVFAKGGVVLEIGRDKDDFSTDQVTVKLRERLACRIKGRDLKAFVKGTFNTAIAAIATV